MKNSCKNSRNKSVFGKPSKTCFEYIRKLEEEYERKFDTLVVDAFDGQHVMPFVRNGNTVDCYEANNVYIDGGSIDTFNTVGLRQRLQYEGLEDKVNIYNSNYYEQRVIKKYDFVYSSRSLHLNSNKNISMNKKIQKLLSSVKENGYIYILYYLAIDDEDYELYPSNQYLRPFEMKTYIDPEDFDIINSREEYS